MPAIAPPKPSGPRSPGSWPAACALAGLVLLFLALTIQKIFVPDLWWQLRAGQLILETGRWPSTDLLSYTVPKNEWIEMRWLFCVAAYALNQFFGPGGLILAQSAVLAGAFGALLWPQRELLREPAGLGLTLLALAAVQSRFNVRPEIVTYLCMSIFLAVLSARQAAAPGSRSARLIWLLPALQVLWTNAHTVFILGPVIVWAFALGDALERFLRLGGLGFAHTRTEHRPEARLDRTLFAVALAVTAACLINPWLHRGALFPLTLYFDTIGGATGRIIQELIPPRAAWPDWPVDVWYAVVFAAVSLGTFILNWRRTDLIRLGLWAAFLFLADRAVRNIGPWGFVALWASLGNLADWRAARTSLAINAAPSRLNSPLRAATCLALGLASLFAAWFVASDRYANMQNSPRRFGMSVTPWIVPTAAVDFLLANPIIGRFYHSMPDGSYLSFAAQGKYPVYIDGRLEVYTTRSIVDLLDINEISAQWDAFVNTNQIGAALIQRELLQPLLPFLAARKDWPIVHLDERGVLFVRDIPEHAELIAKHRINPAQPFVPRAPDPDETTATLPAWLGGVSMPWHSFGLAKNFLAIGAPANARTYLERAVDRFPRERAPRVLLSVLLRAQGQATAADQAMPSGGFNAKEREFARGLLPDVYRMVGRPADGVAALRAIAQETPLDAGAWADYARAAARLGDMSAAAEGYERASKLDGSSIPYRRGLAQALEQSGRFAEAVPIYESLAPLTQRVTDERTGQSRIIPVVPDAFLRIGACFEQLGRADDAIRAYRAGVRILPHIPEAHNQLGVLLARQGDKDAARAAFMEALRVRPGFPPAEQNLKRLEMPIASPVSPPHRPPPTPLTVPSPTP